MSCADSHEHHDGRTDAGFSAAELESWKARAPEVPAGWFVRQSSLHGARHTQRVHIHLQRLAGAANVHRPITTLALSAALWHDIGRDHDGWDERHGEQSAARAAARGLTVHLAPDDEAVVLFAIRCHCLDDTIGKAQTQCLQPAERDRALQVLWLLKDADGLDRVRLGGMHEPDPRKLRHPEARHMIPFACALLDAENR